MPNIDKPIKSWRISFQFGTLEVYFVYLLVYLPSHMAFANLGDALPDINNIEDQSAAGTKVFTACKLSANIAACFGKEFTGFPDTIYELIQGYNVKV